MAVATTLTQAVITDWTDLGAGPFLAVESGEANNLFAIADSKPGLAPTFGWRINSDFGPWSSATISHLWVIGTGEVIVSK
jgi:hypothetical protein